MTIPSYYSQYGEDKILHHIFRKKIGTCVEVGGFDGVTGSNTYFFEKIGWRCLVIEPMPDFCTRIKKTRTCEVEEVAASNVSGEMELYVAVGVETLSTVERNESHFSRIKSLSQQALKTIRVRTSRLDDIFRAHQISEIDFLTIDVEGHELSVLQGLSIQSWSPRIVIIEDNSNGSDRQVVNFMKSNAYVRFRKTGCNDWYAKSDDPLVNWWRIFITEIPIALYLLKQKIKPFVPGYFRRG